MQNYISLEEYVYFSMRSISLIKSAIQLAIVTIPCIVQHSKIVLRKMCGSTKIRLYSLVRYKTYTVLNGLITVVSDNKKDIKI